MAYQYQNQGMLGSLFSPSERDLLAEQQAQEKTLMDLSGDPFRAMAYTSLKGANQAGAGLAGAAANAAGIDVRAPGQVQQDAIASAKAEIAKRNFDLTTPKGLDDFYRALIQILSSKGLAAEAAMMAKEWYTESQGLRKGDLQNQELQRKIEKDKNSNAVAVERNRIAALNIDKKNMPETVKLLDNLDTMYADGPADPNRVAAIMARLNQLAGGNKWQDLGDRRALFSPDGKELTDAAVGVKPLDAKAQAKQDKADEKDQSAYNMNAENAQNTYNVAVQAYNHPGLDNAIGPVHGQALVEAEKTGFMSGLQQIAPSLLGGISREGLAFGALFQQVRGGTFITALKDLQQSGRAGSTGLGALSNVEGQKIQAAKAALSPIQPPADFRARLADYIHMMERSWAIINSNAKSAGFTTREMQKGTLNASKGRAADYKAPAAATPAASPATAPAPAASPAPATSGGRVERGADGKLKLVQ